MLVTTRKVTPAFCATEMKSTSGNGSHCTGSCSGLSDVPNAGRTACGRFLYCLSKISYHK